MSEENIEIVRGVYDAWQRGDFEAALEPFHKVIEWVGPPDISRAGGGWTDPAFALRVYARPVRRRERLTGPALRQFDAPLQWAEMGRIAPELERSGAQGPAGHRAGNGSPEP